MKKLPNLEMHSRFPRYNVVVVVVDETVVVVVVVVIVAAVVVVCGSVVVISVVDTPVVEPTVDLSKVVVARRVFM